MDEELKETVKSLAESAKAMQAKMSTLKSEVTRSDNSNTLAGSHHSDLVSGIPPAAKRRKTISEGDDIKPITDDEAEDEEDENGEPETSRVYTNCQRRPGLSLRRRLCRSWTTLPGSPMLPSLAYQSLAD